MVEYKNKKGMKYLRKTWVKVLVSLIGGGMVTEIIHISTGDPNRPMTANLSLLYALIIFGILTFLVYKTDNNLP
jgi:hypothetical protein